MSHFLNPKETQGLKSLLQRYFEPKDEHNRQDVLVLARVEIVLQDIPPNRSRNQFAESLLSNLIKRKVTIGDEEKIALIPFLEYLQEEPYLPEEDKELIKHIIAEWKNSQAPKTQEPPTADVNEQRPEEARIKGSLLNDPACRDIYFLGARFYHFLTGHEPNIDADEYTISNNLEHKRREHEISEHIQKAIITGMKENRYARTDEFIWTLVGVQKGANSVATTQKINTTLPYTLKGHMKPVYSIAFSPNGRLLASGSTDGTVRVWEVKSRQEIKVLPHEEWVNGVAFSPDGRLLASASADTRVYLWDLKSNLPPKQLEKHTGWVNGVAFSPDGTMLASVSHDKTVRLWEVKSGALLQTLKGHKGWVTNVAFSPDGQALVSASHDRTVRWWDVNSGQEMPPKQVRHDYWVKDVAFSPDGRLLASASHDKTVCLWNLPKGHDMLSGQQMQQLDHPDAVNGVAFSLDGRILASACADNTVYLWHVASGKMEARLSGHTSTVWSVAFSPDGNLLASASADHTVRLWSIK